MEKIIARPESPCADAGSDIPRSPRTSLSDGTHGQVGSYACQRCTLSFPHFHMGGRRLDGASYQVLALPGWTMGTVG